MMTEIETSTRPTTQLQGHLARVSDMLDRHRLVEELANREGPVDHQAVEVHRRTLAELQAQIDKLHPADVAHILDALPPEDRLSVWNLVKADRDGEILLEVSKNVRMVIGVACLPTWMRRKSWLPPNSWMPTNWPIWPRTCRTMSSMS